MTLLQLPLEGHGPHGFDGGFSVLPFVGGLVLLLVLLGSLAWYLWRQGRLTLPGFGPRPSAEDEAKQILADGLARGDISTDQFLERSSVLNWAPGSDPVPARRSPRPRR